MIGKPAWFQRRKYTGWGMTPKTWQGWVYIIVIIAPLALFQAFPLENQSVEQALIIGWAVIFALDFIHIMTHLDRDEREYKIEAISERNSAWAMILVIIVGVGYQAATSVVSKGSEVDPILLITLVAGVLTKAISNFYYSRKSL